MATAEMQRIFKFRSIVSVWNRNQEQSDRPFSEENISNGRLQVLGVSLGALFHLAFFGKTDPAGNPGDVIYGKYSPKPILEVKDTLLFHPKYFDGPAKNLFCYSLIIHKERSTKDKLMRIMQSDLENYFDFDATVETRNCPYWALTATPEGRVKLKTKFADQKPTGSAPTHTGFSWKNYPISDLVTQLCFYNTSKIILDETGIEGGTDINMDCALDDFNDVRKALQSNGLDLVLKYKPMTVLVIKDKEK